MSIWTKITATTAATLMSVGFANVASADVSGSLVNGLNALNDLSGEVVYSYDDQLGWVLKTGGDLEMGDAVVTIIHIDTVNGDDDPFGGQELTGVVVMEITNDLSACSAGGGTGCTVDFGAVSAADYEDLTGISLAAHAGTSDITGMFYGDYAQNLDMNDAANALANATDGTLAIGVNFDGNDFFQGTGVDIRLDAYAAVFLDPNLAGFKGAVTGSTEGGLSIFYWGLSGYVIQDGVNLGGDPISGGGTWHDLRVTGDVLYGDSNTGFAVQDRSDFELLRIPEPGTLGILGMGLLGMAAAGRRRRS